MNLPDLNTDLGEALADLDRRRARPGPQFSLEANRFRKIKSTDKVNRAGIRNLIRPENADVIATHLPAGPGERTHALLRGDFVLCDMIPAIVSHVGPIGHLRIATLGMSAANSQTLVRLVTTGRVERLTLVVSHYFQQVDRNTVYAEVCAALSAIGTKPVITRNHAKVILLPTRDGTRHFAIEGSANLRSSDNVEQVVIFDDASTHDFHAAWIDDLANAAAHA